MSGLALEQEQAVAPVEGHPDAVAFRYGFTLEGKAVDGADPQVITELEDGDLLIEGWAANFEGVDREGENFIDGGFQRGIKSFLDSQASLCFHHNTGLGIGKVLDLNEVEGKGLWMKARVDNQPESSPLRYIYNGVKRGTYNALSVGGFFRRKLTDAGWRIADTDITEISVTPVPIHTGTPFSVVAGKALTDITLPVAPGGVDEVREEDLMEIEFAISTLDRIFTNIAKRNTTTLS